ncbi:hypothetical protein O6H91_Y343800 [Diphasiastrum complanatum]|nr:hypothetical protein O6H91_Y343800 [Diphasiastrum complanatum]
MEHTILLLHGLRRMVVRCGWITHKTQFLILSGLFAILLRNALAAENFLNPDYAETSKLRTELSSKNFAIVSADNAVVAADVERCSVAGKNIMWAGGNAVDAAVTTALCEGVLNPMASGIGGGSFLLLRLANGTAEVYDMREVAPSKASENMYGNDTSKKAEGPLSIGVPGELAGLHLAWQRHGKLPWRKLFQPAVHYADRGYVVHPYLAFSIQSNSQAILANGGLREVYAPGGKLLQTGDIAYHKALGRTLKLVAKHGPSVLYNGALGRKLAADVQNAGGILTFKDLQNYKVKLRKPVQADVFDLTVLGMPPPSSGGAALILILKILSNFNISSGAMSPLDLHRMIEAMKHAYAVRMNLGDPDFVNVTEVLSDMLSSEFAAGLKATIFDNTTFPPEHYGGKWNQLNDHGTCHISIVDRDRNAVALTTTINGPFGSYIVSNSTGILLNNEMDDFGIPTDIGPDKPPPAKVNFVQPYKRPLSSMSPTILLQNGQLKAVLGASGGQRIITTVAQVLINHFVKGIDPLASVFAPRVHHQVRPFKFQSHACVCTNSCSHTHFWSY